MQKADKMAGVSGDVCWTSGVSYVVIIFIEQMIAFIWHSTCQQSLDSCVFPRQGHSGHHRAIYSIHNFAPTCIVTFEMDNNT